MPIGRRRSPRQTKRNADAQAPARHELRCRGRLPAVKKIQSNTKMKEDYEGMANVHGGTLKDHGGTPENYERTPEGYVRRDVGGLRRDARRLRGDAKGLRRGTKISPLMYMYMNRELFTWGSFKLVYVSIAVILKMESGRKVPVLIQSSLLTLQQT